MLQKHVKRGLTAALAAVLVLVSGGSAVSAQPASGNQANIVGGHNASQQYGMVSLWYPDRHRCGATLISPYWAVTAAHCSVILVPGQTQVRASSLDNTTGYEEVGLAAYYVNPNFNTDTFDNDIALIKFQRPVTRTQPLALSGSSPKVGTTGKIDGWGWICQEVNVPGCRTTVNRLQELDVKVVPASICRVWDVNPDHQTCLVAADGSNSMGCFGDSGSGFVRPRGDSWVLMGVTSGDGVDETCATDPAPGGGTTQGSGVWTNVAPYISWINSTMDDNGGGDQIPPVVK